MPATDAFPLEGGCDCGDVRYRMMTAPLFVHCCHSRWCQRERARLWLNAMIEADRVQVLAPSRDSRYAIREMAAGTEIARVPRFRIAC